MEGEAKRILSHSLTEEEYKSIDESVLKKIANILEEYANDYITAKAFFESSCTSHEEKTKNLEKQLKDANQEKYDLVNKFEGIDVQFNETNRKLVDLLKKNADIKDSAQRLEHLANTHRRGRNEAVCEQQCSANILAMREAELDRLKNDVTLLNSELKAAIQAKCEAIAEKEEILAQQIDCKIKLEILESQNVQYSKQILEVNADLYLTNNELAKQRTEFKNEITALKSKIIGKEEEFKKLKKEVVTLRDHNRELAGELDSSSETPREPLEGLQEGLQQQLRAQYRLIDVYKKQLIEYDAHSIELNGTIKELQHLLHEAVNDFGEMETNANQLKQDFETTLQAKQRAIRALKQELKDANHLLDALKQEFTESQENNSLPEPAPLNDLIKSGLTLTQMYTTFVEVNRDLLLEKQEKESFKIVLEAMLKEIKERLQLNLRQEEEYEFAQTSMEILRRKVFDLEEENVTLCKAKFEAVTSVEHLTQSNNRLKDTVQDLSRQVCHLLQKVESTSGNYLPLSGTPYCEMKRCTDVISTHLTIFNDVNELKLINLRLLVSVIELANDKDPYKLLDKNCQRKEILELEVLKKYLISYEGIEQLQLLNVQLITSLKEVSALREREEMESKVVKQLENCTDDKFSTSLKMKELQDHILRLNAQVEELQKKEEHLLEQIEVITSQRDALHSSQADTELATDKKEQNSLFCGEAYQLIEDLRKEYESYKLNKTANEKVLLETIDKLRADFDKAIREREQLACNLEQQQGVNDFIKNKLRTIQNEKEKLEKEVFNNKNTVKQLVGNVSRTNNEVKESLNKLSAAQVTIARLKEEIALLKHNESKLLKERESKGKDKLGQELLLASLENLKEKIVSSETSTTSKLESRLEVANNECAAVRQRLREERDRFSNRMDLLEKQTIIAKQRLEEEIALRQKNNEELKVCKAVIKEREQRLEQLSEELNAVKSRFQHISEKENEIKDLQEIVKQKDITINELQKQVGINKECMTEMCVISQEMDKHLADIVQENNLNTQEAEKKIFDLQAIENDLRNKVNSLEHNLELMQARKSEECAAKDAELSDLKKYVESLSTQLNIARNRVITTENEARKVGDNKKAAEQRVEILASEKFKLNGHLNEVRSALLSVKNQLEEAKTQNTQLKDMYKHQQQSFEDKMRTLNEQAKHDRENIQDLTKLNELLDEQIQKLEAKVSILNVSETANISFGSDDSFMMNPSKETDKLMELVRIMRKEKQTTSIQFEILRGEKLQLEAEVDILKSQLKETIKKIEGGRISSGGELSPYSAEKHNQLLKKMETINHLTENNQSLQECKVVLENKVLTLEQQLSNIEDQIIAPLKMKNLELETMLEQISLENRALKGETKRWQDRTNQLIERTSKNPDELHRLKQENEDISKKLGCEKEHNILTRNRLEEQIKQLRREKEEVVSSLKTYEKNLITFRQELNTTKDCLKETTDKVKQLERAIAAKEDNIIDIRNKEIQLRNIAKKYKAQFQEVTKSLEEERKTRLEANLTGPTAEIEAKLANLNEKMLEIKKENEALQKENGILKTSIREKEDHAKMLMNIGKNGNQELAKETKAFDDIGSVTVEGNSTTSVGVQCIALKLSNMEVESVGQLEKERLEQELRIRPVKLSGLQSQLDERQATYSEKSAIVSKFSEENDDHLSAENQLLEKVKNARNGTDRGGDNISRSAETTSQYATSSTSYIATSPAELASKRMHLYSQDYEKYMPPMKRCKMASLEKSTGKQVSPSYNLEVEYQVPTSSQRDNDDHLSVAADTAIGEYQELEDNNEEAQGDDLLYHQEEVQELDITDDSCMIEQPNNESANLEDLSGESYQCEISLDSDVRAEHPATDISFTSEGDDCEFGAGIGNKHMASSLQQVAAHQQNLPSASTVSRLQNSEVIDDDSWLKNLQKENNSVGSTSFQNSQLKITSSRDNQFERHHQSYTNEQNLVPSSSDTADNISDATIVPGDKPLLITEDAESQKDKSSTLAEFDNSLVTSISRNCGSSVVKSLRITRSLTTDKTRQQQISIEQPLQDTVHQQTQNVVDDQTVLARGTRNQPSTSRTDNDSVRFDVEAVRPQVRKVIRNLQQGGRFQNQPK